MFGYGTIAPYMLISGKLTSTRSQGNEPTMLMSLLVMVPIVRSSGAVAIRLLAVVEMLVLEVIASLLYF